MAQSSSRDAWFFGVGPFQSGSIHDNPRFAGDRLKLPLAGQQNPEQERQAVALDREYIFSKPVPTVPLPEPEADTKTAESGETEKSTETQ